MKYVKIGNLEFSQAICGTNAFYGRSHFSQARDAEYRNRFDDAAVERVIRRLLDCGVNTVETSANERITAILCSLRQSGAAPLHLVGSTRIDEMSAMRSHHRKLAYLLEIRSEICIVHSQIVDQPPRPDGIPGLESMLEKIHAAGLLAGISTHRVRTVEFCESRGYAIDTYLFPLNATGFVYPGYDGDESVRDRAGLVRGVSKPFILMKALGAGRIPPDEGLAFVAENCKPGDLVSLGFGSEEEVVETMRIFEKCFTDPRSTL
jgi:hypothetical protein